MHATTHHPSAVNMCCKQLSLLSLLSSLSTEMEIHPKTHTNSISMEDDHEEEEEEEVAQSNFLLNIISFEADLIYNCTLALFSPFLTILSLLQASAKLPSALFHFAFLLLKKLGFGLLGAVYVCVFLVMLMTVSVILGVGLVHLWVDEPVSMRESLHFGYADFHPTAIFSVLGSGGVGSDGFEGYGDTKKTGVPIGHTFYVSLDLLMPESDYNREVGMFQLTAEVISRNGDIMATSIHPCMLRFTSWPIRLIRTFFMSIPLLLGLTTETQSITVAMLKHKEGFPRTGAIRITLYPRAGTSYLPQLYKAEIVLDSKLPWTKELVYRWKWTFYVWTSFYISILLLITLLQCARPLVFPVMMIASGHDRSEEEVEVIPGARKESAREERDVSERLRRWNEYRNKRKAVLLHTSISADGNGDSESVNFLGES